MLSDASWSALDGIFGDDLVDSMLDLDWASMSALPDSVDDTEHLRTSWQLSSG
jgi:hypothetical protein